MRLVVFLGAKFSLEKVRYIVQDFYDYMHESGRFFNACELKELKDISTGLVDMKNTSVYDELKYTVLFYMPELVKERKDRFLKARSLEIV